MDSDWSVTSLDGHDVTLVTVDLRNPSSVDRRVRVSNHLDGPVLPPKRAGIPEPGWDENGFTGVVPATGRRTLGYACPSSASRPPVSVDDDGQADGTNANTTATAIRELGDPRPPSDAIPGRGGTEDGGAEDDPPAVTEPDTPVPSAVESWLTTVEARLDRGERLTDASVESATAALTEGGDVSALAERVAADAAALEAVAERTAALADRASAVDVPVEALRRLP